MFERDCLTAGTSLEGPAIVEGRESTVVVPPGWRAFADPYGNLILSIQGVGQ